MKGRSESYCQWTSILKQQERSVAAVEQEEAMRRTRGGDDTLLQILPFGASMRGDRRPRKIHVERGEMLEREESGLHRGEDALR